MPSWYKTTKSDLKIKMVVLYQGNEPFEIDPEIKGLR